MMTKEKLTVKLIRKNENNIESIFKIEDETFGKESNNLSMNIWSLLTFIRYGKIFGFYNSGTLKGYAIYIKSWDDPTFVYLAKIAVDSECQGNGYGSILLTRSLNILKKSGIARIGLTVDPNNPRNIHLYCDKFGFHTTEFRKNEYGKGYDRLFMELDLKNWSAIRPKNRIFLKKC